MQLIPQRYCSDLILCVCARLVTALVTLANIAHFPRPQQPTACDNVMEISFPFSSSSLRLDANSRDYHKQALVYWLRAAMRPRDARVTGTTCELFCVSTLALSVGTHVRDYLYLLKHIIMRTGDWRRLRHLPTSTPYDNDVVGPTKKVL